MRIPLTVLTALTGVALAGSASAADLDPPLAEPAAVPDLLWAGTFEVFGGAAFFDLDENDADGDEPDDTGRVGGSARLNIPLFSSFSVQADLDTEFDTNSTGGGVGDYEGLVQVGGHLSWRDPSSFLIGVFGAYGEAEVDANEDEKGFLIGGEAQLYLGNTTLYVQAGYFEVPDAGDNETLEDAFFARGTVRYYLTPDSSLSGDLVYVGGDNGQGEDVDSVGWEVEYKHNLNIIPAAVFVAYDGQYIAVDEGTTEDLFEHAFKVGLSFTFGADTLQDNDRRGVALDIPTEPLKAAGYTVDVVD